MQEKHFVEDWDPTWVFSTKEQLRHFSFSPIRDSSPRQFNCLKKGVKKILMIFSSQNHIFEFLGAGQCYHYFFKFQATCFQHCSKFLFQRHQRRHLEVLAVPPYGFLYHSLSPQTFVTAPAESRPSVLRPK